MAVKGPPVFELLSVAQHTGGAHKPLLTVVDRGSILLVAVPEGTS